MKKLERVNQVEKAAIRLYMANRDFTAFCKVLKMLGIVTRNEIYEVIKKHYSDKYFTKKTGHSAYYTAYVLLSGDLDDKQRHNKEGLTSLNFVQEMKANKEAGAYKKILIIGKTQIYWASPIYGHDDYNKAVWRENTPENRRKMEIINNFLNK